VSGQTKLHSFIEAWANILIGFGINFVANLLVLPLFGLPVGVGQAFGIADVHQHKQIGIGQRLNRAVQATKCDVGVR